MTSATNVKTDWLIGISIWKSIYEWLKTFSFFFWILKMLYRVIHPRIFPYLKMPQEWLSKEPTGRIDKFYYKQYLKNASKKDKAFNEHEAAIRVFQRAGIYEAYAQTAITVGEVNQIDQERTELHRDETEMVLLPGAEHFDIELWEQTGTLDGPARTSFQETSSQTDPQPSSSC